MAIQFNCPYCTASIKVADDAAGKIGKCPKCETKLRVPQPARPEPGAPAKAQEPAMGFSAPSAGEPIGPADVTTDPGAPPLPLPVAAVPETSYARRVRQRQKGSWAALLLPMTFGALLVALAAGYWWYQRDTMTGPMTGERLPVGTTLTGRIPAALSGTSRDEYLDAARGLEADPAIISTDLLQVEFRGGPYGLETWLWAAPEADLVRVPVRRNKLVAQFHSQHAGDLSAPRDAELAAAAAKFLSDWQNATRDGMQLGNTLEFRDSLGLNSLRGALGYHSAALVGKKYYPCVHEDEEGWLYFVVPRGTTSFVVTERPLEGRESVFPDEYRFDVTVVEAAVPAPPADESRQPDPVDVNPPSAEETEPNEPAPVN